MFFAISKGLRGIVQREITENGLDEERAMREIDAQLEIGSLLQQQHDFLKQPGSRTEIGTRHSFTYVFSKRKRNRAFTVCGSSVTFVRIRVLLVRTFSTFIRRSSLPRPLLLLLPGSIDLLLIAFQRSVTGISLLCRMLML